MRRPRWINNPAFPVASIGSFIETVPDFRKMTGRVSDGPTSHAILERGSRIHADGFPKRVSTKDIGKCSTWNFFPFKIYLFMTDFRKKLQTVVDPRLSSTVVS